MTPDPVGAPVDDPLSWRPDRTTVQSGTPAWGNVAVHWPGQPGPSSSWPSLSELLAVHGHGGWTVEWIDRGNEWPDEPAECEMCRGGSIELIDGAIWVH